MKKSVSLLLVLVMLATVIAGCAQEAPEPETIIQTVEVEKEVEVTVVETVEVEVEKTVEVEVEKEVTVVETVEVEKEVEVEKLVDVVGAIPYPDGAPLTIGREPVKFPLEEMIVYKGLDSYSQPEWMDALVADGTLPPVEERVPDNPQVFLESGMSDGLGYVGLLEKKSLREINPIIAGSEPAVGDDKGAAQGGIGITVSLCRHADVQLARPRRINEVGQRGGVADKGPSSQTLDPVGQGPRIHRSQIGRIIPLAAVQFDGHDVAGFYHIVIAGFPENGEHLRHQSCLQRVTSGIHKIHFRIHFRLLEIDSV